MFSGEIVWFPPPLGFYFNSVLDWQVCVSRVRNTRTHETKQNKKKNVYLFVVYASSPFISQSLSEGVSRAFQVRLSWGYRRKRRQTQSTVLKISFVNSKWGCWREATAPTALAEDPGSVLSIHNQPSVTPPPGHLMSSSDSHRHYSQMVHRHTGGPNTHTYK